MKVNNVTTLELGDLCPECGLIICMPPNLMAHCLGCGYDLTKE